MKKPVRIAIIALAVIIALMTMYLVVPGFTKMGNVFIVDFSVSEDGSEMTVTVGVSSSIGYVRKVSEHQQQGGKLYLDCYSAFGGINGSWGAKSEYTIQIDKDTEMIAIYRSPNCYDPVLQKGEDGVWVFSKLIYGEPQEPADGDIIHGEGETLAIEGISQKEVEDIGLEQCKVNYDYTSVGFNQEEHRWIVEFWEYAGKVPTQTVLIDTEGNVLGIRYAE